MDGIFNLPYSEYAVIDSLQKELSKGKAKRSYSLYIPTSRQQKGIDFIAHNFHTNKFLRFQVKSSRTYLNQPQIKKKNLVVPEYRCGLWFNNFIHKFDVTCCDYYILFAQYPVYSVEKNIKKGNFWKSLVLCYSNDEMHKLLQRVKTKREQKKDSFYGYVFNDEKDIREDRGFLEKNSALSNLLDNKIVEIKERLD